MNVRYSPGGLQRIKAYRSDIHDRVAKGWLTAEEGASLVAIAMRSEADGADPRKVKCPECGMVHAFIGQASTFACHCSPGVERSVWDNRIGPRFPVNRT